MFTIIQSVFLTKTFYSAKYFIDFTLTSHLKSLFVNRSSVSAYTASSLELYIDGIARGSTNRFSTMQTVSSKPYGIHRQNNSTITQLMQSYKYAPAVFQL